jgi:hypothetical protein
MAETEKLSEVLLQLNETSPSQLRGDHETDRLEYQDRQRVDVRCNSRVRRAGFASVPRFILELELHTPVNVGTSFLTLG